MNFIEFNVNLTGLDALNVAIQHSSTYRTERLLKFHTILVDIKKRELEQRAARRVRENDHHIRAEEESQPSRKRQISSDHNESESGSGKRPKEDQTVENERNSAYLNALLDLEQESEDQFYNDLDSFDFLNF